MVNKKDICDFTPEELKDEVAVFGEPAHRANQIFSWLNRRGACGFSEMTDLSKSFIAKLEKTFCIGKLVCAERLVSRDGTEKFLWRLEDGKHIESVLITEKKRKTLCISSQVGCRFKCSFCASGSGGFKRDLKVGEIVFQVLSVQKICRTRLTNIVFMGMGEPLDNYDNVVKAIRIMNHPRGIAIGARKITISTCGLVPEILKLKDIGIQTELSISLHAVEDKLRNELVPINRKYPLKKLIAACREYCNTTGRVVTLEYTLIKGKNDSADDSRKLAGIAKSLRAKVNLIACSARAGQEEQTPDERNIKEFLRDLRADGAKATLRKSKGMDIYAACGQLAGKV